MRFKTILATWAVGSLFFQSENCRLVGAKGWTGKALEGVCKKERTHKSSQQPIEINGLLNTIAIVFKTQLQFH